MSGYVTTGTVQVLRGLPSNFNTAAPQWQAQWLADATEQALHELCAEARKVRCRPVWGTLRVGPRSLADLGRGTDETLRHYQATVGTEPTP